MFPRVKMTARAFISLCLVATVALAMPQYGQQQQQANTGKQLQAQPMMPMNVSLFRFGGHREANIYTYLDANTVAH